MISPLSSRLSVLAMLDRQSIVVGFFHLRQ
jgi:hypothetical protein